MLERWELARSHLINNPLYPRVGENIGFSKSDALGRPNVLDEFIGLVLVADSSQDVALRA